MPTHFQRKIIHLDCDCFFAAVELRDNPSLQGKPVAVGGSAQSRGVLSTCNYEARQFGLHSAMPTSEALRRCPQLILLPHRFTVYKEASQQVREILLRYSQTIEPLSLDEAFIDVSDADNASAIAKAMRADIAREVGITASAGVSVNKFLAKVASDWRKPNGQFVIAPHQVADFVAALPVQKIPGVGKATMVKMQQLKIERCADLQQLEMHQLLKHFGSFGKRLYELSRGEDHRPVHNDETRKSLSVENTFARDLSKPEDCAVALQDLIAQLQQRWQPLKTTYRINKVFIKVRFADFSISNSEQRTGHISDGILQMLLTQVLQKKALAVRLLGVGIGLEARQMHQLELF